jgi:RNA polymerase sigma-70 factor (ECF subfamily)
MDQTTDLRSRQASRADEGELIGPEGAEASEASEETRLIRAAQASIAAFDTLYERYLPRVYRYMRAHVGDDHDAADLTQLVFLRVLQALPHYQPGGVPFAVWLFHIARHAAIDAHRRQRPTVSWDASGEALRAELGEPLQSVIQQEELERLRRAVSRLPREQQELLALSFAAGLTAPNIASILGIKPDAVRKRLSRVIAALKESYHAS